MLDPRLSRSPRRPAIARASRVSIAVLALLALLVSAVALGACQGQAEPSPAPATRPPIAPIVQIDDSWTAVGGQWTFTGYLDPEGYSSDVVLQVGSGTANAMQVSNQVPVSQAATAAGPITVTTSQVPKVDQVCVRFHATSEIGSSDSRPLCFPYSPPTAQPAIAPTIEIDPTFWVANGSWTFGVNVDPGFALTDLVLQVGHGPASKPAYTATIDVAKGLSNVAYLSFSTKAIPEVSTVCVRFVATNSVAKVASKALCFPRSASS